MSLPLADLKSLLRARKLDRTLTSTLPSHPSCDELVIARTGIASLDARLAGGFPRGQLSELIGPRSSGRTSLVQQTLAAATSREELVALVDALDAFYVESAGAAGIAFDRLLWVRGHVVANPGMCRDLNQRAVDQAIKALTLVLQAGNFGLVVLDVADAPHEAIRRLPFTTWLRLQRMVEGTQTACVLVGTEPMARSSAGLTLRLGAGQAGGAGRAGTLSSPSSPSCPSCRFKGRLFAGLKVTTTVVRARAHVHEETTATFTTTEAYHA